MREDAKTKKETGRVSEQLNSPAGTLGSYAAAAAVTAVFLVLLFLRFDAYYDLNDDVLMEDLLSGAYTGAPAFRNIQRQAADLRSDVLCQGDRVGGGLQLLSAISLFALGLRFFLAQALLGSF